MSLSGKHHTAIIIDDPYAPVHMFKRSKSQPLCWVTRNDMNHAWIYEEVDKYKLKYPAAKVRSASYYGMHKIQIIFDNEADEAEFIMRESI